MYIFTANDNNEQLKCVFDGTEVGVDEYFRRYSNEVKDNTLFFCLTHMTCKACSCEEPPQSVGYDWDWDIPVLREIVQAKFVYEVDDKTRWRLRYTTVLFLSSAAINEGPGTFNIKRELNMIETIKGKYEYIFSVLKNQISDNGKKYDDSKAVYNKIRRIIQPYFIKAYAAFLPPRQPNSRESLL
ncbi:MAG: hypothetical protein LBI19_03155 [Oscillospiraceae bacterium]|jgi:hypothetical protein|nr:hypothetical protein [Oscillospiraceae bacterium]